MRKRGLLLCLLVAGSALAVETTTPSAQELTRIPTRLLAFLPRSPLPDSKYASDDDGAGCRGIPGTVMEGAKTTNFAGLYSPVMKNVIADAPQTIPKTCAPLLTAAKSLTNVCYWHILFLFEWAARPLLGVKLCLTMTTWRAPGPFPC